MPKRSTARNWTKHQLHIIARYYDGSATRQEAKLHKESISDSENKSSFCKVDVENTAEGATH